MPLGALFAFFYFVFSYYLIKLLNLKIMETELQEDDFDISVSDETLAFITALGGKNNIVNTDACITRLRMSVNDSSTLQDEDFMKLGAKGVIRPDRYSIQVVLGAKAERVAEKIKEALR